MVVANIKAKHAVGPGVLTIEHLLHEYVSCTHYLVQFEKDLVKTLALIDFGSKINAITQLYAIKLGLKFWITNIGAQKIG